jgi:hypothetical protein
VLISFSTATESNSSACTPLSLLPPLHIFLVPRLCCNFNMQMNLQHR